MSTTPLNSRANITLSVLGLVVTLSGMALTWYSNDQSTKASAANSCIQRIDNQENHIRAKADILLGEIAKFSSKMAEPDVTELDFHHSGQDLIEASMKFTAYAPAELTQHSMHLAATVQFGLMAKTTEEKIKAINLAKVSMAGWPNSYFKLMDKYEERRNSCLN